MDARADQDGDRPALPSDVHHPGRAETAGTQRLVLSGPGPTRHGAGRRGGGRVGEGGVALRGRLAAARGAWLVFEDEAGFSMTPPQAKTWSQRGRTPVVRVRGRSRRRISIAALTCYKPGHRSRLIYRPRRDDGRRDGRKSFSWRDYRDLLIAAHQQLGGPIVLVWDNCETHGRRPGPGSDPWDNWPSLPCSGSVGLWSRAVLAAAGPAGVSR